MYIYANNSSKYVVFNRIKSEVPIPAGYSWEMEETEDIYGCPLQEYRLGKNNEYAYIFDLGLVDPDTGKPINLKKESDDVIEEIKHDLQHYDIEKYLGDPIGAGW